MWQTFVPATGRDYHGHDGPAMAGKKRRRAVAPGDGAAVSAVYESIVRPGELKREARQRDLSPKAVSCFVFFSYRKV